LGSVAVPATNNFLYDLNGNLRTNNTRIYDYDDEDQLIRVTEPGAWKSEYVYDGMLRRRITREYTWQSSAWVKTNEVRYVYDVNLVIQERDANNLPLVTYTRGDDLSHSLQGAGGIGGLLARTDNGLMIGGSPWATAFYFYDGNGNVMNLVYTNGATAAQYTYDPFGNTLTMSGPLAVANTQRFSSKEWCGNAGLYYYGRRFYDPNTQRWLNRDPMVDFGSVINLSSKRTQNTRHALVGRATSDEILQLWIQLNCNFFSGIYNNPINSIDSFGECPPAAVALPTILAAEGSGGPPGWVLLAGTVVAAGIGMGIAETINRPVNPTPPGVYYNSSPSAGVNSPPSSVVMASSLPRGFWPAPSGAREWGRNNDVSPKEAQDRFHDIKQGDNMSQPPDDYGVNPNTGDVCDPEGEVIGNLGE